MKVKLIQIALGTIGSILTLLVQHYTSGSVDPTLTVVGGVSANALFGNVVENLCA